jgi:hypothetical protein
LPLLVLRLNTSQHFSKWDSDLCLKNLRLLPVGNFFIFASKVGQIFSGLLAWFRVLVL